MDPKPIFAALLALALLGCQQQEVVYDVPTGQAYRKAKTDVWDAISNFLRANQITVKSADPDAGVITATRSDFQDMGWAECKRARVVERSDSERVGRGRPISRDLGMRIEIQTAADQTLVGLVAEFTEEQINPFRNLPFNVPCRSTGALERALLAAI